MDLHSSRILIHRDFIEEIYNEPNYKKWFKKLQQVSNEYPNIMCDNHFKFCSKLQNSEGKKLRGEVLLIFSVPKTINLNGNENASLMKACIQLSSKKPYKTLIFCSEKSKKEFLELDDYKNYSEVQEGVKVLSTKEALLVLDLI